METGSDTPWFSDPWYLRSDKGLHTVYAGSADPAQCYEIADVLRYKAEAELISLAPEMAKVLLKLAVGCEVCGDTMDKCAECKYELDEIAGHISAIEKGEDRP